MTAAGDARALVLAQRLLELGEQERASVTAGRLDELPRLADVRRDIVEELDRLLPAGELPAGPLRALLLRISEQGSENVALIGSLHAEMKSRLETGRRQLHAAGSYSLAADL